MLLNKNTIKELISIVDSMVLNHTFLNIPHIVIIRNRIGKNQKLASKKLVTSIFGTLIKIPYHCSKSTKLKYYFMIVKYKPELSLFISVAPPIFRRIIMIA